MQTMTMDYSKCIKACQDCAVACENCLSHMIGTKSNNDCPACCLQCVEFSQLCVRAMAGGWHNVAKVCRLTAEVMRWCAEECGQHDMDHCQDCAKACRKCATECEKFSVERAYV